MISYKELRQNKTGFTKARAENPVVLKTAQNAYAYAVLGATGIYAVSITADYSIDCSCQAGKHNQMCYHVAAALVEHLIEAAEADAEYEQREMERHERPTSGDYIQ